MILYVLIGLALASFVIAFFSARTWHWGYVVVVELFFLATMGFFLLVSETVRINAVYPAVRLRTIKNSLIRSILKTKRFKTDRTSAQSLVN